MGTGGLFLGTERKIKMFFRTWATENTRSRARAMNSIAESRNLADYDAVISVPVGQCKTRLESSFNDLTFAGLSVPVEIINTR